MLSKIIDNGVISHSEQITRQHTMQPVKYKEPLSQTARRCYRLPACWAGVWAHRTIMMRDSIVQSDGWQDLTWVNTSLLSLIHPDGVSHSDLDGATGVLLKSGKSESS